MTDRLYIQVALERFMDGSATEQEEQMLAEFFATATDIPEEWKAYAVLFRGFQRERGTRLPDSKKVVTVSMKPKGKRWMAVAAVAVLLIAVSSTLLLTRNRTFSPQSFGATEEYVAYIYGQRTTDRDVVLGEMKRTMAVVAYNGSDVVEEQLKAMFSND